jgi:hypothetical protein
MKSLSHLDTATLPQPIVGFLRELEAFCGDHTTTVRRAFVELQDEALDADDAEQLFVALSRVAALPLPFLDRLNGISDILAQRGIVKVTVGQRGYFIERRPQ